eukprot:3023441-Karenia_brevis.AAC.1
MANESQPIPSFVCRSQQYKFWIHHVANQIDWDKYGTFEKTLVMKEAIREAAKIAKEEILSCDTNDITKDMLLTTISR